MRCFSRAVSGVVAIFLLVSPSMVLSRRASEKRAGEGEGKTDTEIHPIAMFIAGTVSVAGSLFSLHKHQRLISLDRKQKKEAEEIVHTYMGQQEMGCRMLDQTAVLMTEKRKGLVRLIDDDRNGTHSLAASCLFNGRMEHFQKNLQEQFQDTCALLNVEGASAELSKLADRCNSVAEFDDRVAERICSANGEGLAKAVKRTDLVLARLDGVMSGLCDGLPGFNRSVEGIATPKPASSFIDRQVSGKSTASMPMLGLEALGKFNFNQAHTLDMIALGYSILGTMDFGLDLYDTAVVKNDGYSILLDVVKQDVNRQQQLLWRSFQVYWLDVAWMRSVQLATLAERYQAGSLKMPDHISALKRAETAQRWHQYGEGPREGSYWSCNTKLKCLVPVWHGATFAANAEQADKNQSPPTSSCATQFGDLKMCQTYDYVTYKAASDETKVHAAVKELFMAPRRCFGIYHGGMALSKWITNDIWIYHYGSNAHIMTRMGNEYDEAECLEPLRSLAQSTVAETDLRRNLIGMSSESSGSDKTTKKTD